MKSKTQTIYFTSNYGKQVEATVNIYDDEITVINLIINGVFYTKQQCSRHAWLLYKAIKNHLNF